MSAPERIHTYSGVVYDSARWNSFMLRAGDIIVCTPPKCGTTWTQMLCALLVHQNATLPQPLTRLSRWLDRLAQPIEEVVADLDAQPFRRVIKTHTPLDGLPFDARVSYVVCGRDPRDAFLSMMDHLDNFSVETVAEIMGRLGVPGESLPFPKDPNVLFPVWMTTPEMPWMEDGFPWGSVFYYMRSFWKFRRLGNIAFLHYADLSDDLDAEMRRLSAFLGISIDEVKWPSLVAAGRFESMKAIGDEAAPGAHLGEWRDANAFFRMARRGQWRDALSAENQALYEKLSAERLEPRLKAWLEGGGRAADAKGGRRFKHQRQSSRTDAARSDHVWRKHSAQQG
ncbi:sulfotransferase domain-containing protein [Methylocystis sp. H62]|uniref:sulfotransferase domain-containing protein n=1 Tax=Methylocystis sp. H62 TaxID=2785789 RepID=UPI0018C20D06|nr:sulfotransferase domain-containing protein [Methylocystis sp. H62]MBG0792449.1 sulfotransferase domain-containing protein [Methylocystis sp. H62]